MPVTRPAARARSPLEHAAPWWRRARAWVLRLLAPRYHPFVRSEYPSPEWSGSWAHTSAWGLLSPQRRTLSAVLLCADQAALLVQLLPELSQRLTESGYAWELVVVDAGSDDDTERLLRAWCQQPGFRALVLRQDFGPGITLGTGLQAARGDGVVVLSAGTRHPLTLLRKMVLAWEGGADLSYAVHDAVHGRSALRHWRASGADSTPPRMPRDEMPELMLIDRRLMKWLLG